MDTVLSRLREWASRLAATCGWGRSDRDLQEELRIHVEMAAESARRAGEPGDAVARAAAIRHGGITQAVEAQRAQHGLPWLADLGQDLRYGLRVLTRNPGFALVVILSLALGIGANTAIFTVINALMLRPLPARAPNDLVSVVWHYPDPGEPRFPVLDSRYYEIVRDQNHVFSAFVGTSPARFDVAAAGGPPESVRGEYVVGTFFPTLGIRPVAGRLIDDGNRSGAADLTVAVVSWSYWQRHFNLDPSVIGRQITVNGVSASVIGVAPRAFTGLLAEFRADVWIPAAMEPLVQRPSRLATGELGILVIGRLKPGVSKEQASAEARMLLRPKFEAIAKGTTDAKWRQVTIDVEPAGTGFSMLRDLASKPMFVLMAGAALLLLLACTNIASLLLARGAARRGEMALRVSLGADRFRLVRQVMTESLLLAGTGCLAGLVLAYFGANALVGVLTAMQRVAQESPQIDVQPDAAVLLFTAATGFGTAILFGLVPAWQAFSLAPASSLSEGRRTGEPKSRRLFASSLVVGQVALSAVLLSTAGLFAQYLSDLRNVGLGFNRDSVLVVSLNPRGSGLNAAMLTARYRELLDRLQAIPGVRSATLSVTTPIAPGSWLRRVRVDGFEDPPQNRPYVFLNAIAPKYFETLGTPLLAGRDFDVRDANGPRVAIVNQAMARHYFSNRTPLGERVTLDSDNTPFEIVGVVADAKYEDLRQPAPRTVYLNAFQAGQIGSQFALRTDVPPLSLVDHVRRAVDEVVKPVRLERVTTLADQMDASLVLERTIATISGVFSAFGALLAAMGLFGLLAYTVARRTGEIGVRMALGATQRDVIGMVLKNALALVACGFAIGIPAAFWSKRLAAALIENLPIDKPFPIAFAILGMTVIAIVAASVPARRAARVRLVDALRHE
jgi:putative ABC transport system permease protein